MCNEFLYIFYSRGYDAAVGTTNKGNIFGVFLFFGFFTDLSFQILLFLKLDNNEIDQSGICLKSVSNKPNRFFCFPKDYQVTYVFTENDNLRKPMYK